MNNGRVRIYELSKDLNLDNRDILAVCEKLNIQVKSHSSTITEADAIRIRETARAQGSDSSAAVRPSTPSEVGAQAKQAKRITEPPKKRQQILEIRRSPSGENGSSPSPTPISKPPSRPKQTESAEISTPSADEATAEQPTVQPLQPAPEPPKPKMLAKRPQVVQPEQMAQPEQVAQPENLDDTSSAVSEPPVETLPEPLAPEPSLTELAPAPALVGPPVRPQRPSPPAPENRDADGGGRAAPTKPNIGDRLVRTEKPVKPDKLDRAERPERSDPARSQPQPRFDRSGDPASKDAPAPKLVKPKQISARSDESGVDDGPPSSPSLRKAGDQDKGTAEVVKPKPPRRPAAPPKATPPVKRELQVVSIRSAETSDKTDDTEAIPEEDTPESVISLPELRRPDAPSRPKRGSKAKVEVDDDEEKLAKPGKVSLKAKRRNQPLADEDEDLDELLDDALSDSEEDSPSALSLSLMRPPKPKSAQPASKPAAASPKRKRPSRDGSGESSGGRSRRDRRTEEEPERPQEITLEGSLTVTELAGLLMVPETEIVKALFFKGIAANVNQNLDLDTATVVAQEFGVQVHSKKSGPDASKTEMLDEEDLEYLHRRPPVVTIMGHVDHGKTTLLDAIRHAKVAQGEAGGITQHIGAYHVDVEHEGQIQQVVFLDTPGHEAFTAMRARGAKVTDVAILVVAADDGAQPQTIEAISHAKAAGVPIIVAINKIDKEGANPDRVRQELMEHGLVPEEWGGDTIMVPVSAINGENLDTLLEMILLVAEVEDLQANPDRPAKGTVIEAHLDRARGPVATLLVQNGTLRVGDIFVAGSTLGRVRAMTDDQGKRVEEASPSFAVEVLGLDTVPAAGDEFDVFLDEKEARAIASVRQQESRLTRLRDRARGQRPVTLGDFSARAQEGELKELNLILKADVQGSVEAIVAALSQLPQNEVQLRVLLAAAGEITQTDIELAAASSAVILGFNTTLASGARQVSDQMGVDIRDYNIIYKLLDDVQGAMEGLLDPELVEEDLGMAEVRAVFTIGRGSVAGCYIKSGKVVRNCNIRVLRGREVVYQGFLDSLKRVKDDVKEVNAGFECGIGVNSFNDWQEGDIIESYRMVTKRRTLTPA